VRQLPLRGGSAGVGQSGYGRQVETLAEISPCQPEQSGEATERPTYPAPNEGTPFGGEGGKGVRGAGQRVGVCAELRH
jgi:hypothetical protein